MLLNNGFSVIISGKIEVNIHRDQQIQKQQLVDFRPGTLYERDSIQPRCFLVHTTWQILLKHLRKVLRKKN